MHNYFCTLQRNLQGKWRLKKDLIHLEDSKDGEVGGGDRELMTESLVWRWRKELVITGMVGLVGRRSISFQNWKIWKRKEEYNLE